MPCGLVFIRFEGGNIVIVRLATESDVPVIHNMIQEYVNDGTLLPRTVESLYRSLPSLVVADAEGELTGVVALHRLDNNVAEVRTLTVAKGYQGQGIGQLLVQYAINLAEDTGYHKVISFTTQIEFFSRCGFAVVARNSVPTKYYLDCVHCSKLFRCDETAMERVLVESPRISRTAKRYGLQGNRQIIQLHDTVPECEPEAEAIQD